ncbi:MAG: FecR family protein [Candidatus Cryptobacteroides sp.]
MKNDWDNFPVRKEDPAVGARIWKKVRRKVVLRRYVKRGGVVSAALLAAASVAIFVSVSTNSGASAESSDVKTVEILAEASREILLPDGSVVYLDAGSKLSYPESMDGARSVSLSGNAIFDIRKTVDLQNFIVNVEASYIEVKGTSFAVSTKEGQEVSVVLYSGAVDFVSTSNGQSVSLKPSNRLSFNLSDQSINVAPSFPGISWNNGFFLIDDAPLESLTGFVSWKYNVKVSLAPSISNTRKMNGAIRYGESGEDVMQKICYMFDLKYEFKNGEYRISEN